MAVILKKVVRGLYSIESEGKVLGCVEKRGHDWVVLGENGLESGVHAKTRKRAVELFVDIVTMDNHINSAIKEIDEKEAREEAEIKYAEAFDAYYVTDDIAGFAGKPCLEYDLWFKAKYGISEWEANLQYEGGLAEWYLETIGLADLEEAEGYIENDADEWNNYVRDWKSVNKGDDE
jgi:hypothetical protein